MRGPWVRTPIISLLEATTVKSRKAGACSRRVAGRAGQAAGRAERCRVSSLAPGRCQFGKLPSVGSKNSLVSVDNFGCIKICA